jgi:flagellar motor switch protein FliM
VVSNVSVTNGVRQPQEKNRFSFHVSRFTFKTGHKSISFNFVPLRPLRPPRSKLPEMPAHRRKT